MFKNNFSTLALAWLLTGNAYAQTGQPLPANNLNAKAAATVTATAADGAAGQINRQITTIDELVRSGQLRRTDQRIKKTGTPKPQAQSRAPVPRARSTGVSRSADTTPSTQWESGLQLLTTFDAVGLRRAQLRASGDDILVHVGDRIKGGWQVIDIAAVSVHLKRCIKNQCREKILHLGED